MWRNKFAKYILEKFIIKQGVSENDKIIYLYGLTEGITIIENIIITLLIGYVYGNMIQTIIFLLSYIPLRSYAGGYHAKTEKRCFIYSILMILAIEIYFSYSFQISYAVIFLAISMSVLLIMVYSPIESESKLLSITEKKFCKQRVYSILALEYIIILLCMFFKQNSFISGIAAALFIETILVLFGKLRRRQ